MKVVYESPENPINKKRYLVQNYIHTMGIGWSNSKNDECSFDTLAEAQDEAARYERINRRVRIVDRGAESESAKRDVDADDNAEAPLAHVKKRKWWQF